MLDLDRDSLNARRMFCACTDMYYVNNKLFLTNKRAASVLYILLFQKFIWIITIKFFYCFCILIITHVSSFL